MTPAPVRVAILSPEEVVCAGLAVLLGRHPERVVVVEVDAGVEGNDVEVVLYDALALHETDGADLLRLVGEPDCAVLVLSRDLRPDLASRALALGAAGFLSLGADEEELLVAVESAASGWRTAGSSDEDAEALRPGHEAGLTGRESEVLAMITQGYSNQEIADLSYLSINSVKTYIRGAYRRIGVTNRSQAVVWALQHGFTSERG